MPPMNTRVSRSDYIHLQERYLCKSAVIFKIRRSVIVPMPRPSIGTSIVIAVSSMSHSYIRSMEGFAVLLVLGLLE